MESSKANKTQADKFKDAARETETDDDEKRFNEKLGKVAAKSKKKASKTDRQSD